MNRLHPELEFKFDETTGRINGYASLWDIIDRGADVVQKGAFKATLGAWKRQKAFVPMLWQHDPSNPIGYWDQLEEDEKGLKVGGQLLMQQNGVVADVPQARTAYACLQAKAIRGLSIGYETLDYLIARDTGVRQLKKLDLWEISVVTFAMLPEAQVTGVKSDIDPRELERALRSTGLSSADAVKAVAIVKQHLRDGGDQPDQAARDGAGLIMSLRKAAEALR